ncbi:MAG: LamG domain-containing protein, partial [Caulobacteraceae bacterium]|nr:LamG domain-containing protein [Caulobacteraceae bacterium]
MPLILGANSVSGYTIKNSLRFNSGSSDYLSRTLSTNGNKRTFTLSCWLKRSSLSAEQRILMAYTGGGAQEWLPQISSANKIKLSGDTGLGYNFDLDSDALFRDVSAWYHIVVAVDTTQATSSNRIILYVNGTQQTLTGSYPSQNFDFVYMNTSGSTLLIGGRTSPSGLYLNGYLSEMFFIDGQALTPSSFGQTDTDTGIWIPKAYTGTYGTNGFYLQFKNSASLGTDSSGNGNT